MPAKSFVRMKDDYVNSLEGIKEKIIELAPSNVARTLNSGRSEKSLFGNLELAELASP